ncbi:Lsr2 family DNA-binding protein [Micromonospora sp. IBHARD004]|uniref:Lsr2 family DNA-binding protein n=1 Tax=Micromonospora sp. IBHARD004 TaxID=3457764 RepID=UPI004059FAC4
MRKTDAGIVELTPEADAWIANDDSRYLVGLIHSRIRFVGEALAAICAGVRTHEELLEAAISKYGVSWSSLDQVRRRTNWLRAGGFLEKWSHLEVVPTDEGRKFLALLDVVDPTSLPHRGGQGDSPVDLPEPESFIADLLESLDDEKLSARKRVIGFLPAGREGETVYESVRRITNFCSPRIEKEEFRRICASELGLSRSSTDTALAALRSLGLIQPAGFDIFEPTPWAQQWLESSEPIDFARIAHCHVIMFAELIHLLPAPTEVGDLMTAVQRVLGDDAPQRSEIAIRLRLLAACGLLVRVSHTSYMASPLGKAFAQNAPSLQPMAGPSDAVEVRAEAEASATRAVVLELEAAAVDSREPTRFEHAVFEALRLLGLNARHLGGPGRTDILVSIWLAPGQQRRVTVDAKSSSSGQVLEGAISFDAIEEHRVRHDAEKAVIVGPSFPDGRLRKWARTRNVRLIDVATLTRYLELNELSPLSPAAIAGVFDVDMAAPETIWEGVARRQDLMNEVIATLWREANDDREIARSGGMLDVTAIRYLLREKLDPDPEEIQEVLAFLASPLLGSVRRKGDKYFPVEPPEITSAKLSALGVGRASGVGSLGSPSIAVEPRNAALPQMRGSEDTDGMHTLGTDDPGRQPRVDAAAVRLWAAARGIHVRDKGRLPSSVVQRYMAEEGS